MESPLTNPADARRPAVSCDLCGARDAQRIFEKHGDNYVRCRQCGLLYIDPQPSDAELAAIYGAHYYDAWGIGDAEDAVARLKRKTFSSMLRRLREKTGLHSGALLDLGCATGFLLEEAREVGFDPYGVELNEFSAAKAREKLGANRIHCGTLESAPFVPGSFEVVVMSDVLEHVRSPRQLLRETRALLRPGGALVVVAPDSAGLSSRLLGKQWTDYKREHLYSFDRRTLPRILEQAAFAVLDLRAFPKYLDLDYVHRQLAAFPTPLFTPLVKALHRITPKRLRRVMLPIHAGSMMAVAVRRD